MSAIGAIRRFIWLSNSCFLYHAEYLAYDQQEKKDYDIIFGHFSEIYRTYHSDLSNLIGRASVEYLRLKLNKGDPYIILAVSNNILAHVSFIANTSSYSEYPILNKSSRAIGPCVTKKEFRGKGIYPTILRFIRGSSLGRNGLDIFCNVGNISSQKGIEKAGFTFKLKFRKNTRVGFTWVVPEK